jgi:prophage regulatory protein
MLIRLDEVTRRTGLRSTSIYEAMKAGTFPKSVKITPKAVAWVDTEIDAWVSARIAEREAA